MGTEATTAAPGGLFDEVKREMASFIEKGFDALETDQSKFNKAVFAALTMEQRDKLCQSLGEQGVKPARIEKMVGKSQPTVNRHMNGKNS